jgi:hypothetical protein
MSRIFGVTPMSNYATFKEQFKRSGYSANNFYDVIIELDSNPKLLRQLSRDEEFDLQPSKNLLRLYTDEASIPGLQISTGDYRITNTPNLKYAYGAVFSEMQLSFMMDADSRIKSIFDLWTNWIYGYADQVTRFPNQIENIFRTPAPQQNFRAAYRDDYTVDILIVKYEKYMNGKKNSMNPNNKSLSIPLREIIPDSPTERGISGTGFYRSIPVHAVKLFNAFPSNISSMSLSREETSISKLSVGFEYETYTTTTFNDNSTINFRDPINGGGELDIIDTLLGILS